MKRQDGFYWVKLKHNPKHWQVCEWTSSREFFWDTTGFNYKEDEALEINETRILNPDEKKELIGKVRKEFFKECVDEFEVHSPIDKPSKMKGVTKVNVSPHNLFEWFKNKLLK